MATFYRFLTGSKTLGLNFGSKLFIYNLSSGEWFYKILSKMKIKVYKKVPTIQDSTHHDWNTKRISIIGEESGLSKTKIFSLRLKFRSTLTLAKEFLYCFYHSNWCWSENRSEGAVDHFIVTHPCYQRYHYLQYWPLNSNSNYNFYSA